MRQEAATTGSWTTNIFSFSINPISLDLDLDLDRDHGAPAIAFSLVSSQPRHLSTKIEHRRSDGCPLVYLSCIGWMDGWMDGDRRRCRFDQRWISFPNPTGPLLPTIRPRVQILYGPKQNSKGGLRPSPKVFIRCWTRSGQRRRVSACARRARTAQASRIYPRISLWNIIFTGGIYFPMRARERRGRGRGTQIHRSICFLSYLSLSRSLSPNPFTSPLHKRIIHSFIYQFASSPNCSSRRLRENLGR